ncbi:MAG: hypothetical protein NTX35_20410 [Verrucomicrobia bacterium]|nr:hypothetical protein [Verrucomicrobiota bacterium]
MMNAERQGIIDHLHLQALLIWRRGKGIGVLGAGKMSESEAKKQEMTHE